MAAPVVVGVGAPNNSNLNVQLEIHASTATDDVMLMVLETQGDQPVSPPAGWANVTNSPVAEGVTTRLTVLWKRYVADATPVNIADPGDHIGGAIISVRGCPTAGNPWDVTAAATVAVADAAVTWPGVATTQAEDLVFELLAGAIDNLVAGTQQLGAVTNANYASITEQLDYWHNNGNGGGVMAVSGVMAAAGATGGSTATLAHADTQAKMTLALKSANPAAAGGGGGLLLMGAA